MTWPFILIAALYSLNPVTISIYPQFAMRPATFRITVLVPRHPENRRICFGVSGPEDKKSCEDVPGFESRKTWTVFWELRTTGEYEAVAVLTRMEDGKERRYTDVQPFRVVGVE